MIRKALVSLSLCTACVAHAGDHKMTVTGSYADYTDGAGSRALLGVESSTRFGDNTLLVNLAGGSRSFGNGDSFDGDSLGVTFYRDWSDTISTRTSASVSSDDPVFVNRLFDQDLTWRGLKNATFTGGARYAEYDDGHHSTALYAGAAYYLKRLTIRYRYTHYDLSDVGDGHANLLSLRFMDAAGRGHTQLWFGEGTSIQDYDWAPVALPGEFQSVALRRVQPLGEAWDVNVGLERSWHQLPTYDYQGTTVTLGLARNW